MPSARPYRPEQLLLEGKPVPDLPLTGNDPVCGINNGTPFNERTNIEPVRSIEIWGESKSLKALRVDFDDKNSGAIHGNPSKGTDSQSLKLDPGERITRLFIWRTQDGNAVSRTERQTSRLQELKIGEKPPGVVSVVEELGTGLLAAVTGSTSNELKSVAFRFFVSSQKPASRIINIRYAPPPAPSDITPASFYKQTYENGTGETTDWHFSGNKSLTSTQEWMKSSSEHFEESVEISGGFLGMGAGASAGWSVDETKEHGTSWSETEAFDWSFSCSLKPGQGVKVESMAMTGQLTTSMIYDMTMYV